MLSTVAAISLFLMAGSIVICTVRALIGPSAPDRIVALDTIGIILIGFIAILMIVQDTIAYAEVALVIAILAFIGSVAIAKFVEGGIVLDRDRH
ncbi:Na(+)/H(+) antiporter subunit F1 [Salisediminibacterium halotolerans]|uniref:Na(+)/H(+) antiporter subunit F1 n=1 Tax=Salisediminibacterium halotolerans TaxID=517425 RepID=UPI000EAE0B01|nr:Na(+)/H(+) antiporter subunit F1 [Salisediminibacterium halotolerans]RLJ78191.1 multisubunit sodium/proton antiporter MrpF subunit [Actinophytocola xinjiangensis]RPE88470.1 multisubunit sodium/proton antiporter MrpF subunit [Salisediminibacterium halotolerans]TWG37168.1 multisubunit sodium/proton antiporter MrpF subunit [Salisediminibacterium halotolerans]GEL08646.1 Na(+)/H(+) antiporter subunit F [Salisediminibacterium halotolerans]